MNNQIGAFDTHYLKRSRMKSILEKSTAQQPYLGDNYKPLNILIIDNNLIILIINPGKKVIQKIKNAISMHTNKAH